MPLVRGIWTNPSGWCRSTRRQLEWNSGWTNVHWFILREDDARITTDAQLVDGSILHHLDAGETYIYLGVEETHIQEAQRVKDALRSKYRQRLRQI